VTFDRVRSEVVADKTEGRKTPIEEEGARGVGAGSVNEKVWIVEAG
jgi:hypothetical protein